MQFWYETIGHVCGKGNPQAFFCCCCCCIENKLDLFYITAEAIVYID